MALILVLTNQSHLADVSDYNYEVMVGDGTPARSTTIAAGTVKQHLRANGWQALVKLLLDQHPVNTFVDHRTRLLSSPLPPDGGDA